MNQHSINVDSLCFKNISEKNNFNQGNFLFLIPKNIAFYYHLSVFSDKIDNDRFTTAPFKHLSDKKCESYCSSFGFKVFNSNNIYMFSAV